MFTFKQLAVSHPQQLHARNISPNRNADDIFIRSGDTIHILCCNRLLNVFKRIAILRGSLKIERLRCGFHLFCQFFNNSPRIPAQELTDLPNDLIVSCDTDLIRTGTRTPTDVIIQTDPVLIFYLCQR